MGIREHYRHELRELERDLIALGRLVDGAVQRAIWSLRQHAHDTAATLIRDDDAIDSASEAVVQRAMGVIATQGPVAGDLRTVGAYIQCANELERIGDYAEGIARLVMRFSDQPDIGVADLIDEMAREARAMLGQALAALSSRDADLNLRLKQQDDRVDACYDQLFEALTTKMQQHPELVVPGTYMLWVGHNLERIADRATNIAEHVEYIVRGQISSRPNPASS